MLSTESCHRGPVDNSLQRRRDTDRVTELTPAHSTALRSPVSAIKPTGRRRPARPHKAYLGTVLQGVLQEQFVMYGRHLVGVEKEKGDWGGRELFRARTRFPRDPRERASEREEHVALGGGPALMTSPGTVRATGGKQTKKNKQTSKQNKTLRIWP